MTSWRPVILATFFAALALSVDIQEISPRSGNTVQLRCEVRSVTGELLIVTDPTGIFLNSSALVVTTLLEERDIDYNFDPETKIFSFDIQQDLEGCYYCGNSTILSQRCITLVAYPVRDPNVPRRYEVPVGQPVRLLNGVGEGALASHYDVWWNKGYSRLTETEDISYERGDDFSLLFSSVRRSDSGTYRPTVKVTRSPDVHYVEPDISIELVVYSSPQINKQPTSVVAVQDNGGHGSVSFSCVASGGPNLRVSWMQNVNRNLTSMPDPRYLITADSANSTITSELVIKKATHLDSGSFHCVAYIMDRVDVNPSPFMAVASATLTVLDTKFQLQTRVTGDKELQIWINLEAPLPDPVRAMVCFTSTEDEGIQRHHVTSSSQTNSTALFFLLHFPDIPEDVRDGSFKVQVALKVGITEGPLVPSSLEEAETRNINDPTENNCEKDTIKIIVLTVGGATIAIALLIAASVITFGCYKCKLRVEKTKTVIKMPTERYQDASKKIEDLVEKITKVITDPTKTPRQREELRKVLESDLACWRGVIKGEGDDDDDTKP